MEFRPLRKPRVRLNPIDIYTVILLLPAELVNRYLIKNGSGIEPETAAGKT